MNYNVSRTELYLIHIEGFFLLLSSDFHEGIAYTEQQDQRQRNGQDECESSTEGYQQVDDKK